MFELSQAAGDIRRNDESSKIHSLIEIEDQEEKEDVIGPQNIQMVMGETGGSTVGLIQDPMVQSTVTAEAGTVSHASSVFTNCPLISALFAFAIAQSIKVLSAWYRENRWDVKLLIGSGGMPSSHSATVTALAMAVGLKEGFGGSLFAAALILACVVMYDATGVRLQAGRQAEVLNQIVCELPSEHPLAERGPLRELLGHTPPQVIAGALLGVFTATLIHIICSFSAKA